MERIGWPGGSRCAVSIGFDFDAETFFLEGIAESEYPNPVQISRGAYGARVGLPRILEMLDRLEIPSTFFVPGYVAEKYLGRVQEILERGHEIGHHGYLHASPLNQSEPQQREEIERGLEALNQAGSIEPKGYRTPSWEPSHATFRLLEEYGFLYDSSLMADEVPYPLEIDGRPSALWELPVDWLFDDAAYYYYNLVPSYRVGMADPERPYSIWKAEFDGYYASGACFVLVCHPQISGRAHRLGMLERFLAEIRERGDVWFARGAEVIAHCAQAEGETPRPSAA